MKTVIYDPDHSYKETVALADGHVEMISDFLIRECDLEWDTTSFYSTENIIYALRCALAEGRVAPNKIQFAFQGQILPVNRYGQCETWPKGFHDTMDEYNERILVAMSKYGPLGESKHED